ncbi:MAG: hypothetical protein FWC89_13685, partial [Defluviitaleaceae bacterium]|nr:hypothetical protein [Defluviitaleaceae bacterium]
RNFAKLLDYAKSHIAFQVGLVRKQHNLETTEGRVNFTQESAKILASLPSEIERDAYVNEIAKASDISPSAIRNEIAKITGETGEYTLAPRMYTTRKRGEDSGLINAKKGLLQLVLTYPEAASALQKSEHLSPEEMGGGIFGKLLSISFENAKTSPADLIDLFETSEEQQLIAEIFTNIKEFPTKAAITKALTDMVKKIKLSWLNSRMEIEKSDLNAVKSLHFQIKSVNLLNISMHDG